MSKKVAKGISIVLCTLLISSITACGSKSDSGSGNSSVSTSAVGTAKEADKLGKYTPAIKINVVRTLDSTTKFDQNNPDAKSITENIWQKSYLDDLGIDLNYLWTPTTEQYGAKWNTALASGDIPDMALVDATIYKTLVNGDLVEDMTQYYEQYAGDTYKQCNEEDGHLMMKYMTFEGKMLGLPVNGTQPDDVMMLGIRKDWLKKVNMTEPKTIDELVKVAAAFKEAKLGGADTYGLAATKNIKTFEGDLVGFLNGYGAYYDCWVKDSSGSNLVYGSVQPEVKSALLKLQEMYKNGLLKKDFAVDDGTKAGADLTSGKVGIEYMIFWAPLSQMQNNINADPDAEWEVITIPTIDGSSPKLQASAAPAQYFFVKKGFKYPEAALKIINYNSKIISAPENNLKYNINEAGLAIWQYCFNQNQTHPWKNLTVYKAVDTALKTGDEASFATEEQKATYKNVKDALAGNRKAAGYDLIFGQKSVFSLINSYKDNNQIMVDAYQSLPTETMLSKGNVLKTDLDATFLGIIMGDDISKFDKAVETWKKNGGDQITKEVNDWYSKNK